MLVRNVGTLPRNGRAEYLNNSSWDHNGYNLANRGRCRVIYSKQFVFLG
jgi:hypothetical protein